MKSVTITLKNALKIHTMIAGNSSNPPIILLHGWPASSLLWRNIIPSLSKKFYVIAPDLPGHGNSDKPLNIQYNLSYLRDFILNFMDALQLDTVTLAAHDLGGIGALSFAARHQSRLDNFIIMNTSPYNQGSLRLKFALYLLKQPALAGFLLTPFIFKQVLKTGIYNHQRITQELIDLFTAPWMADKTCRKAFSKTISTPINKLVEPVERLKSIKMPTLILWGKKDLFFPFRIARQLHQDIQTSTLVGIENTGHFCQEEEPEFIARTIRLFMDKKSL